MMGYESDIPQFDQSECIRLDETTTPRFPKTNNNMNEVNKGKRKFDHQQQDPQLSLRFEPSPHVGQCIDSRSKDILFSSLHEDLVFQTNVPTVKTQDHLDEQNAIPLVLRNHHLSRFPQVSPVSSHVNANQMQGLKQQQATSSQPDSDDKLEDLMRSMMHEPNLSGTSSYPTALEHQNQKVQAEKQQAGSKQQYQVDGKFRPTPDEALELNKSPDLFRINENNSNIFPRQPMTSASGSVATTYHMGIHPTHSTNTTFAHQSVLVPQAKAASVQSYFAGTSPPNYHPSDHQYPTMTQEQLLLLPSLSYVAPTMGDTTFNATPVTNTTPGMTQSPLVLPISATSIPTTAANPPSSSNNSRIWASQSITQSALKFGMTLEQLAEALQNIDPKVLAQTLSSSQNPEFPVDQQNLAIAIYQVENHALYQRAMLLNGYNPEEAFLFGGTTSHRITVEPTHQSNNTISSSYIDFALRCWQAEGQRLRNLVNQQQQNPHSK